jgi:DNA-binding response OmpR family regulator
MKKILVVDDEEKIRKVIREYAEFNGYKVVEARDGLEALNLLKTQDFDAIVMDVMMPKLDGFSASKEMRKIKAVPIILLSARGEEYDKLFGFELGIDDYMVKPFSPKELIARLNVVIGRNSKKDEEVKKLSFEGLIIDQLAHSVFVDGAKCDLSPKEYDLLLFLSNNKNIAFSREKLLSEVWGYDFFGDDRTIDTHIKTLRTHLGIYRKYIVTLRGLGYKFEY